METQKKTRGRPRLFVGSSTEGKAFAEAIQLNLDGELEVIVWSQGVFGLSQAPIEALDRMSQEFDFAVLVVTPDDVVESRGDRRAAARDNILFEAGLFMGRLGRDRTFLVCPKDGGMLLPSDLTGLTVAYYSGEHFGNRRALLGPASSQIKEAISLKLQTPAERESWSAKPVDRREHVVRPRRCNSLGIALAHGPKEEWRIVNISESGALLATHGELPVGKILNLELQLDDDTVVSLTARVVRVQQPGWRHIGGVGVAFTAPTDESIRALRAFVESSPKAA
jgi:hypothetical protein